MKKISTLVIVLFVCIAARSQQLQKGSKMLGGTVSFISQKNAYGLEDDVKNTLIGLHPTFGRFYRDNRAYGVNFSFSRHKKADDSYLVNAYGLGLFLRQYLPLGKSFYLFAEEGAAFSRYTIEQEQPYQEHHYDLTQHSFSVNFYPGIAYAITKKFQLELSLNNLISIGYSKEKKHIVYTNGTPEKNISGNSFFLNTGFPGTNLGSLGFGIKWFLR